MRDVFGAEPRPSARAAYGALVPRPLRIQAEDALYHLTARAVTRRALFRDVCDWQSFEAIVARTVARHRWSCLSYCFMTTHYHLLVRTPEADLSAGMQRLNGAYGRTFNLRHGETGHVFEARFDSELVETEEYLLEVIRYIALNPVRAGACLRPEEWRWSSFRSAVGLTRAPDFLDLRALLATFAPGVAEAQFQLRDFVEAALTGSDPVKDVSRAA
jgi:REP-associated tyrosine transposase